MFENSNETWKDIPNYSDYMISNLGRLYSKKSDKYIRPDDHNGVVLYNSGGHATWSIQVLMGCIFLGNDINDPCRNRVLFRDGNSSNCILSNLYIEDTSDLPGEMWKPLLFATGRKLKRFYQVSNMGRIKSIKHYVEVCNHSKTIQKPCPELMISCVPDADGYCFAYLACEDGSDVNAQVHRLVAAAFCPNDDPEHKDIINHIDGNPSNNRAENLEWCTQAENVQHAIRTGLRGSWEGRNLRYPVLRVETHQLYNSLSDVDRAMGRTLGYCLERIQHGHPTTDADGNVWTLQIIRDLKLKVHTPGQHCTIDEFPGKEFISLSEASLAIGRWDGYISDSLKRGSVIRNKAGQVMHLHLIGDAPVVSANEVRAQKKAAGLLPEKKERIKSKWSARKPVRCVETGEVFASLSAAGRSIGRDSGYIGECFAFQRKCYDREGKEYTFEFVEDQIKIPYKKNRCYIEELPGEEFANLNEASRAIGRSRDYITDRIHSVKPILSKEGQLIHFHYVEEEKESKLQSEYYAVVDLTAISSSKKKSLFNINP